MHRPSPTGLAGIEARDVSPLRVGLTGGIGSGKSTVAQALADLGALIVDTDAISRELTGPGGRAVAAIRDTFGESGPNDALLEKYGLTPQHIVQAARELIGA